MANAPDDRPNLPRNIFRSHIAMSQGQHGFDASRLSFESDRDSSFDDMVRYFRTASSHLETDLL
jgi:hypothetical protein